MRALPIILFAGAIVIVFVALYFLFPFKPLQTTQLSSARNVSGIWEGKASFTDRALDCSYQGDMTLNLNHNGNNVNGNFILTVK